MKAGFTVEDEDQDSGVYFLNFATPTGGWGEDRTAIVTWGTQGQGMRKRVAASARGSSASERLHEPGLG